MEAGLAPKEQVTVTPEVDEVTRLRRENDTLTRRIRTLYTYNQAVIERNAERAKAVIEEIATYDCLCGASTNLMQEPESGYNQFIRSAFPIIDVPENPTPEKPTPMEVENEPPAVDNTGVLKSFIE